MNQSKFDCHIFDNYLRYLGNKKYVMLFSFGMFSFGIFLSFLRSDWLWFSRFGSLITISGLLLVSSPVFIRGIYLSNSSAGGFAEIDEDGNSMVTSEEDRSIGESVFIGIIISIVGTVIWGFGDLLGIPIKC